tara:strand:- start:546 stop:968 length:423 start_codon:yes stop_codon:yes gene_type:complete
MMSRVSLRLKLSDFINSDVEKVVMNKVNHAHNDLNVTVLLYLWFEENEINSTDLKKFLMSWEDKLSFRTIVKQGSKLSTDQFIWFDIIPTNTLSNLRNRFQYCYTEPNKILDGLDEFYNITKFTISDKPTKRQKRNDYED